MKKIICFVVIFSLVTIILSGCRFSSDHSLSPSKIAKEQATTILECLKTGKSEELKSMFCEQVASTHDLDKEIAGAIEFIDGNIVDDGTWIGMSEGGRSVDNGITTKLDVHPSIIELSTDSSQKYSIFFDTYLIYADCQQNVGMTYVIISDKEDNEYMIGEIIF